MHCFSPLPHILRYLITVVHADVAAAFPLSRMLRFHRDIQAVKGHSIASVMGVKVR
jgi:hypothetical protein